MGEKVKLIGISGKAGAGKDEVARIIRTLAPEFKVKKFAGKLKEIASILLNEPVENFEDPIFKGEYLPKWGMTVREFLQRLGTEGLRNGVHTDGWVIALMDEFKPHRDAWIVTDVRFPNEANAILKAGGELIRINRPGAGAGDHPSETALDNYIFRHIINNDDSIEYLEEIVELTFNMICNK